MRIPHSLLLRPLQQVPLLACLATLALSSACASLKRSPWLSQQAGPQGALGLLSHTQSSPVELPQIPGFEGVRGWSGTHSEALQNSYRRGLRQRVLRWQDTPGHLTDPLEYQALVLGAGGPNGSFGAGLLIGWSESGERPVFDLVTGVSAGALLAPFAFVGHNADPMLREAFGRLAPEDIYRQKNLLNGLLGESLMDNQPLIQLIERYVDAKMLDQIALGHEAGRRLYVGSTDFDLGRLVIWDMGAIAVRRSPEALSLFRKVLLASAAIPVFYPPVLFEVQAAGGIEGDELHVDGALASPMFMPSDVINIWQAGEEAGITHLENVQTTITVIHNGALDATREAIERDTVDIALRSFLMISWSMVQEDVRLLYLLSRVWGAEFRFACIPDGGEVSVLEFGPEDAQRLFQEGYRRGIDPQGLDPAPPASIVQEELRAIQPLER